MPDNLPLKLTHAESVAVRAAIDTDLKRWLPIFLRRFAQHDRDNLMLEIADELRRIGHRLEDEALERHAPRGTNGTNGTLGDKMRHLLAEGTAPKERP